MKNKWIEIAGWSGVVLILTAYVLNNFSVIRADLITYHILNILGAVGIIADGYGKKDWQPVALNAIWLLVAVVALAR